MKVNSEKGWNSIQTYLKGSDSNDTHGEGEEEDYSNPQVPPQPEEGGREEGEEVGRGIDDLLTRRQPQGSGYTSDETKPHRKKKSRSVNKGGGGGGGGGGSEGEPSLISFDDDTPVPNLTKEGNTNRAKTGGYGSTGGGGGVYGSTGGGGGSTNSKSKSDWSGDWGEEWVNEGASSASSSKTTSGWDEGWDAEGWNSVDLSTKSD